MANTFVVRFGTENAAFADEPAVEVVRILRELADFMETNPDSDLYRLRDVNGNRVGFARFEQED